MSSEIDFRSVPEWEKDFHRKFNGCCYTSERGLVYAVDPYHEYDWENDIYAEPNVPKKIIDDFLKEFSSLKKTYKTHPEKEEVQFNDEEETEDIPNTILYYKAGHFSSSNIERLTKESLKTGKDLLFEACKNYPFY